MRAAKKHALKNSDKTFDSRACSVAGAAAGAAAGASDGAMVRGEGPASTVDGTIERAEESAAVLFHDPSAVEVAEASGVRLTSGSDGQEDEKQGGGGAEHKMPDVQQQKSPITPKVRSAESVRSGHVLVLRIRGSTDNRYHGRIPRQLLTSRKQF